MKTARFLVALGIVVMIVELAMNLYNIIHLSLVHAIGINIGSSIVILFGSFFQGGVLIGLGKILEAIQAKKQS